MVHNIKIQKVGIRNKGKILASSEEKECSAIVLDYKPKFISPSTAQRNNVFIGFENQHTIYRNRSAVILVQYSIIDAL